MHVDYKLTSFLICARVGTVLESVRGQITVRTGHSLKEDVEDETR